MFAQEVVTITVIDSPLRASHSVSMLTAHDIREELIRQISEGRINQAAVARKLGVAPARVTEMKSRSRKVQDDEVKPLAEMLGLSPSPTPIASAVQESTRIPNWGNVAQGVWIEQSEIAADDREHVSYDRFPGDPSERDLFAVTPVGNSMNKRFLPGTKLICRLIPFGSGDFRAGQYVIVERTAHDLREMTCKRVEIDDAGVFWLHSESWDERFSEPWRMGSPDKDHHIDSEIRVVAKVIRAVQDLENGQA